MIKFIQKLDPSWIRGFIAIIFSFTLVLGFFKEMVPVDILKDVSLIAVSFYFAKSNDARIDTPKPPETPEG